MATIDQHGVFTSEFVTVIPPAGHRIGVCRVTKNGYGPVVEYRLVRQNAHRSEVAAALYSLLYPCFYKQTL